MFSLRINSQTVCVPLSCCMSLTCISFVCAADRLQQSELWSVTAKRSFNAQRKDGDAIGARWTYYKFNMCCSCSRYNMMSLPFYILVLRALLTYYYSLLHFIATHHINCQTTTRRRQQRRGGSVSRQKTQKLQPINEFTRMWVVFG